MLENRNKLKDITALVTGGSRGVGRGVALGLGEYGATIYITGRNVEQLNETAVLVEELGGVCIPLQCDHNDDIATKAVFDQIQQQGKTFRYLSIARGEDMKTWSRTETSPGQINFGNNHYGDGTKSLQLG
jgi:NAD(P)-dependent dehydrogenase (short-subunit alcohol dehydrogenase family)